MDSFTRGIAEYNAQLAFLQVSFLRVAQKMKEKFPGFF